MGSKKLPFGFLRQVLEPGITRGTVQRLDESICVCTAALSADSPVVDGSTLPSGSQMRLWSLEGSS